MAMSGIDRPNQKSFRRDPETPNPFKKKNIVKRVNAIDSKAIWEDMSNALRP